MRNGMLHQNFVLGVVKVSFIKYYLVVQRKTHALYYIVRMCLYFYEKVKKSVLFVSKRLWRLNYLCLVMSICFI